jgi:hypothetical protein
MKNFIYLGGEIRPLNPTHGSTPDKIEGVVLTCIDRHILIYYRVSNFTNNFLKSIRPIVLKWRGKKIKKKNLPLPQIDKIMNK